MDLNEQLKGWLMQQAQPGSFIDKAGLGLAQAGQTIGQDAAAGAAIMNDPRNSWIGMNPLGRAVSGGLGLVGMMKPFYHGTTDMAAKAIQKEGFNLEKLAQGADLQPGGGGASWLGKGIYLAPDQHTAEIFAHAVGEMHKRPPAVLKALIDDNQLLDMTNPKEWEALVAKRGWPESYNDYITRSHMPVKLFNEDINKEAMERGLKGVIYPNETVVFDPSIIQVEGRAP